MPRGRVPRTRPQARPGPARPGAARRARTAAHGPPYGPCARVNPAGPYGDQYASLGGQGLNVSAHCPKERQQAALAFVEWFSQDSVQAKWAQLGGYACNIKALESADFAKIAPYNPAFAKTMTMVKDFWNIPEYGPLLASAQKYLHAFIVGNEGTAKQALDGMAAEQQQILVDAGYIKK